MALIIVFFVNEINVDWIAHVIIGLIKYHLTHIDT